MSVSGVKNASSHGFKADDSKNAIVACYCEQSKIRCSQEQHNVTSRLVREVLKDLEAINNIWVQLGQDPLMQSSDQNQVTDGHQITVDTNCKSTNHSQSTK